MRWLYERFDVVFAPSRLMCSYLNSLGVRHAIHQPLGVDAEIFCPQRRTLDLRKKLGLARDTRLLVYAGRFAGEKNVPILLQAFAQLGRPYHLLLIGGEREARPIPISRCCPIDATASSWRSGSPLRMRWCTPAPVRPLGW